MATITLTYDAHNMSAKKILETILTSGFFKQEKEETYNPEFVEKIQKSRLQIKNGQTRKIATADLWK
jgi:hypothetical protein